MNHGKNVGFNFLQVRWAHKSGNVINFIIVACRISSRLKWYKNYKNRLRLAKNKMSHFYGSLCIDHSLSYFKSKKIFKNNKKNLQIYSARFYLKNFQKKVEGYLICITCLRCCGCQCTHNELWFLIRLKMQKMTSNEPRNVLFLHCALSILSYFI